MSAHRTTKHKLSESSTATQRSELWPEALATGIHAIDQQHYQLLSDINDMSRLHQTGQSTQALDELLPSLKTYILFHFQEEEKLMARTVAGTEFQRKHLAQHRQFEREIEARRLLRTTQPGTDPGIAGNLCLYLETWLVNHIIKADKQLARFVRAQQVVEVSHLEKVVPGKIDVTNLHV